MFYRNRRFYPPLLLQREGRSTTLAAATALLSSPMSIKRLLNSFFHIFSKIIKNAMKTVSEILTFLMVVKPPKQSARVLKTTLGNNLKNIYFDFLLKIKKAAFWYSRTFHKFCFLIIHIFYCLGAHAGVI